MVISSRGHPGQKWLNTQLHMNNTLQEGQMIMIKWIAAGQRCDTCQAQRMTVGQCNHTCHVSNEQSTLPNSPTPSCNSPTFSYTLKDPPDILVRGGGRNNSIRMRQNSMNHSKGRKWYLPAYRAGRISGCLPDERVERKLYLHTLELNQVLMEKKKLVEFLEHITSTWLSHEKHMSIAIEFGLY